VATLSRPFDSGRNGFLLGEGAAFLVLEEADHAARRGAHILARIAGFHKTSEAWRITCSNPDGSSYESCMRAAIADAGMTPMDIGHVNCHGTSTTANDACEAMALKRLFGERAAMVPITANKSALGHALGASGVLEFILSVRSLETGVLLPTLNFLSGDQATSGLDVVTTARRTPVQTVMSTSFGFGGENCALVLAKDLA
jgi:3-oxoacyl-[acyl-carrier-protein] synthase II